MVSFHEGKDGEPKKCTAETGHCPLGGKHYESPEKFYEEKYGTYPAAMTKDLAAVTDMYEYLEHNKDKHTPEELSSHANTHPEDRDAVFSSGRFDYAAVNEELRAEVIEASGRTDLLYDDATNERVLNDYGDMKRSSRDFVDAVIERTDLDSDFVVAQSLSGRFSDDDIFWAINRRDGDFLIKWTNEANQIDSDLSERIMATLSTTS